MTRISVRKVACTLGEKMPPSFPTIIKSMWLEVLVVNCFFYKTGGIGERGRSKGDNCGRFLVKEERVLKTLLPHGHPCTFSKGLATQVVLL